MATRDKLKTLRLIERISRNRLETLGAELAGLRAQQAELDRQSRDLAAQAAEESRQSTTDTRPYLPRYLADVDDQRRAWSEEADIIEQQAAGLETELLGAFSELKTRETIRGRAEQDRLKEIEKADMAITDDAGRALYLNNRAAQAREN